MAGIYATLFGLLTRRRSGRLTGAVVAWLAMTCAGVVIAGAVEPTEGVVQSVICAGAIGGMGGGAPIALCVSLLQLFETRGKNSGPTQFSLAALLWIVLGFAVLFAKLRLYSEYERRHRWTEFQILCMGTELGVDTGEAACGP